MLIRFLQLNLNSLSILNPITITAKCDLGRSWKQKVEPIRVFHRNIALCVPYMSVLFNPDTLNFDRVTAAYESRSYGNPLVFTFDLRS